MLISNRGITERWTHQSYEHKVATERLKSSRNLMTDLRSEMTAYCHHIDQWLTIHHSGLEPESQLHTLSHRKPEHDQAEHLQELTQYDDAERLLKLAEEYES